MCSIFVSTMDNYQGDLTDILRASGTSSSSEPAAPQQQHQHQHQHHHDHHDDHWQHHHHNHHNFSSDPLSFSSVLEDHRGGNYFGDPFSTLRDPFLQELPAGSSSYFNINTSTTSGGLEQQAAATSLIDGRGVNSNNNTNSTSASSSVFALEDPHPPHHDMRSSSSSSRPCKNIFSNMIQISPNAKLPYDSSTLAPSPRPIKPSAVVSPNISINATNTSKDSLVDNSGVQISSSRNTGLKRRKNQAKKVVCIPAPAAANSRQTGEVVPSDLWAWRKYGQKPIKGSPYPRGYYRCSSSKGCSARKQVERSRTDPNMLVITYTSEHNHPWPTQRNALAGSTRSQPSKTTNASLKNSETSQPQKGTTIKAKEEENNNSDGNINSPVAAAVKEEMEDIEKLQQLEMDEGEFSDGIGLPYKPSMMETNQLSHEDFFAELGEIEADPLNLLFTQGFGSAAADDHHQKESKALDPFHLFDWSENTNNTTNSFEEPNNKRRL